MIMAGLRKGPSCSYWLLLGFLIFLLMASLACLGVILWWVLSVAKQSEIYPNIIDIILSSSLIVCRMVFAKPYCENFYMGTVTSSATPSTATTTGAPPRPGVSVLKNLRADLSSGEFSWFDRKVMEEVKLLADGNSSFTYSNCQQTNNQVTITEYLFVCKYVCCWNNMCTVTAPCN